jgi:hypothetical protein
MTEDILMNVIEYVNVQDRQRLRQTCALIQNETKKKVGYLRLNWYYSRKYLLSAAFREEVLMSIANPKKQVSLWSSNLFESDRLIRERFFAVFKTVHGLHHKTNGGIFEIRQIGEYSFYLVSRNKEYSNYIVVFEDDGIGLSYILPIK